MKAFIATIGIVFSLPSYAQDAKFLGPHFIRAQRVTGPNHLKRYSSCEVAPECKLEFNPWDYSSVSIGETKLEFQTAIGAQDAFRELKDLGSCRCSSYTLEELAPFTTDLCSGFPDGNYRSVCCARHDLAYWAGGPAAVKRIADENFRRCVSEVDGSEIAFLGWIAVRNIPGPYSGYSFRWGYGWPKDRGYKALTDQEREFIAETLPANLHRVFLTDYLNAFFASAPRDVRNIPLNCEDESVIIELIKDHRRDLRSERCR